VNKLKLFLGVGLIALSCLIPLLGFWVASLPLPVATKSIIIGILTVGGPELLVVLAVALLGKEAFHSITSKILPFLNKLTPQGTVSRNQYKLGLALLMISFVPASIIAYAPHLLPDSSPNRLYFCIGADLLFIVSLFVLGGEFWDKLRALFIYDAKVEFPSAAK
jgi:hypothetical protein